MAAMFGLYDVYHRAILRQLRQSQGGSKRDPLPLGSKVAAQAAAATLAGSTEALLAPLERAQSLLQHRRFNGHFSNTWDVFRKLYPYGAREYYRGLTPILLRNGPSSALFFCLRGPITDLLPSSTSPFLSAGRDFLSGAVLGATISTLFFPVNVAKSVMQSQLGGPFPGMIATVMRVHGERGGFSGLFRGVHVNYTRSLLSWGIINCSYELLGHAFGVEGAAQRS